MVLLHIVGFFTESYRINLDQTGFFTRQRFFTENYRNNLDQKGSFTCQRFFLQKISNKS